MSKEGYNYEKLINLVPKYDEKKLVNAGINLTKDAQSKTIGSKVKRHNTEWVPSLSRTANSLL